MNVSEACGARYSARAFLPDAVPGDLVRELLELAHRGAPSGGNLQPWRVYALTGEPLDAFRAEVAKTAFEGAEYEIYPRELWEPYRGRRSACGEDLYGQLEIARDDKAGRMQQLKRNAAFYGAPVGLFFCIDRKLGSPQWADVGMFMQTLMLLAVERGLATCAQEFWAAYPRTIARTLDLPEDLMVFAGMALGRPDPEHAINRWRTRREPFDDYARMIGFGG